MNTDKQALYDHCRSYAAKRIHSLHSQIRELQEDLNSETKSTAGDQHETGRAMMQLELERLSKALDEAERLEGVLKRISSPKTHSERIIPGSLVECGTVRYYLAISAGACTLDGRTYYCVSAESPVGQQLLGKTVGDTITLPAGNLRITATY